MKLRANQSVVVTRYGHPVAVRKWDEIEDTDPIVKDFPWLFTDEDGRTVERATAAPGEKRSVRIPKK